MKTYSQFVWASGRAAKVGRAILVYLIGHLPLLEALPSFHGIFGRDGRDLETKWQKQLMKHELKNGFF